MERKNTTTTEKELSEHATKYVQQHKKEIIKKFIPKDISPEKKKAVSIFMAGSPGAGKTELSKRLINTLEKGSYGKIIRIDPDDIREMLPGYTGNNSYLFQKAVSRGVEKIQDTALRKNINFLLDGTLSNYNKAQTNIDRSLAKNRFVIIMYVYLDPFIAWEITRARELKENRHIPKDAFIKHLFNAQKTVALLKKKYGSKLEILLAHKKSIDRINNFILVENIEDIDKYITIKHNSDSLQKNLPND